MPHPVALITGGATGIGKAVAMQLASHGTNVVISGRRQDVGYSAISEIAAVAKRGAQVRFIRNDVSDEPAVKALIDSIVVQFGRLDMAVNNAGIFNEYCTLDQSDTKNFRDMLNINVMGLYYCMKYEIAQMLNQGKGSIVNLASIAGLNGIPWGGTYAATKHAVVGLTKTAALDHAAQGIRVNAVAPGAIRTDIIAEQLTNNLSELEAMHPMQRVGNPTEVANGIYWLLSDEASFVTGHILNVDGGFQAK